MDPKGTKSYDDVLERRSQRATRVIPPYKENFDSDSRVKTQ